MSGNSSSGVRKVRDNFVAWARVNGEKVVIGKYPVRELADAIAFVASLCITDLDIPNAEYRAQSEYIFLAECLGVLGRFREITGWELCEEKAFRYEEMLKEEYIYERVEAAIRKRREQAMAIRQYRHARELQFVATRTTEYPDIPTMSAAATEEANDLPEHSGIYFVWCPDEVLQYVGQAVNIRNRVNLRHPRIQSGDRVSWLKFPIMELYFAESYYIGVGRPLLNFGNLQDHHRERAARAGELNDD